MHKRVISERLRLSYREGVTPNGHIFENHTHPSFELIAVLSGSVNIALENVRYSLSAGEIAIIPPLAYHSVFCDRNSDYERITVLFDKSFIPREIEAEFADKTALTPISRHSSQFAVLSSMREAMLEKKAEQFEPLLASLITELVYTYTFKASDVPEGSAHPVVRSVITYVDSHIGEKILLDDLAASAFVSKSTISHIFLSEMKISVKQYVLQKKLSYAARLIAEGKRATEAARLVGYENYPNFYKAYKNVFGHSPKKGE